MESFIEFKPNRQTSDYIYVFIVIQKKIGHCSKCINHKTMSHLQFLVCSLYSISMDSIISSRSPYLFCIYSFIHFIFNQTDNVHTHKQRHNRWPFFISYLPCNLFNAERKPNKFENDTQKVRNLCDTWCMTKRVVANK